MYENRPLRLSLRLLYLCGQSPLTYDLFAKIATWLCFLCVAIVWPLVMVKMFQKFEDIDVLILSFESMMSLYQLVIKLLTMNLNRKKFAELLRKMDAKFWDARDYKAREVSKIVKVSWWSMRIYCFAGAFLVSGFAIKPLIFNSGKQLPLICWTPDGDPIVFYAVIYAMQAYIFFIIYMSVGGFDLFYTAMNVRLCVQFKLLRYELENLVVVEGETTFKLKKCIEHHRFLLDCCNEFLDIYSFVLLNQYLVFIITICVELYGLTETNDSAKEITCILYLFQIGVEAVLICTPPTLLEDESSKVATSAYLSNWNEIITSKSTSKSLSLLMMRSQTSVVFNAGGLFAMNVQCLINILNTGISFYTLMKNKRHD